MANRIVTLDIAKAICIVLVVIGHYAPTDAPEWYNIIHNVIYTFHMPLFMFASGYIYIATKKEENYGAFLSRKVRRLLIPYFTTSVIVISFKLLSQGHAYVENPVSLLSYVKMFYAPEAGYFLWFVWALWWMFVIVPLFKSEKQRLALFGIAVLLHFIPIQLPDVFCLNEFKRMLIYFVLGTVVYEYKVLQSFVMHFNKCKAFCITMLFIVIEALNSDKMLAWGGVKNYLLNALLPFIGILFVLELSKLINEYAKKSGHCLNILMLLSSSSYIIYLFHTTFEGFAKALCHKLIVDAGTGYVFIAESTFVILVGIAVPVLLYRFILKRYIITRKLFGL